METQPLTNRAGSLPGPKQSAGTAREQTRHLVHTARHIPPHRMAQIMRDARAANDASDFLDTDEATRKAAEELIAGVFKTVCVIGFGLLFIGVLAVSL